MDFSALQILHALATAAMFGVIWLVQRVHYPLLAGPFLSSEGAGRWTFSFAGVRQRFEI